MSDQVENEVIHHQIMTYRPPTRMNSNIYKILNKHLFIEKYFIILQTQSTSHGIILS